MLMLQTIKFLIPRLLAKSVPHMVLVEVRIPTLSLDFFLGEKPWHPKSINPLVAPGMEKSSSSPGAEVAEPWMGERKSRG